MARIFTQTGDQLSLVEEKDDHYIATITCPCCPGRRFQSKPCAMRGWFTAGRSQSGFPVVWGQQVRSNAIAVGDTVCGYCL